MCWFKLPELLGDIGNVIDVCQVEQAFQTNHSIGGVYAAAAGKASAVPLLTCPVDFHA
jgi:hypothetical protein